MSQQDNVRNMIESVNRYSESNYKLTKGGTKIPKKGDIYYETHKSNKRYINKLLKKLIRVK